MATLNDLVAQIAAIRPTLVEFLSPLMAAEAVQTVVRIDLGATLWALRADYANNNVEVGLDPHWSAALSAGGGSDTTELFYLSASQYRALVAAWYAGFVHHVEAQGGMVLSHDSFSWGVTDALGSGVDPVPTTGGLYAYVRVAYLLPDGSVVDPTEVRWRCAGETEHYPTVCTVHATFTAGDWEAVDVVPYALPHPGSATHPVMPNRLFAAALLFEPDVLTVPTERPLWPMLAGAMIGLAM